MKKSIITIKSNLLKGIIGFSLKDPDTWPRYALHRIGFSMDESSGKRSSLVRYHVSDGHIAITGTCGKITGPWLPKTGVALPASIYQKAKKGELTISIEGNTWVTRTPEGFSWNGEFEPEALHAPVLGTIPISFGGTLKHEPAKIQEVLVNGKLSRRVLKHISTILGFGSGAWPPPIRLTFLGHMQPIIFTSPSSEFDFVAAQMPMSDDGFKGD